MRIRSELHHLHLFTALIVGSMFAGAALAADPPPIDFERMTPTQVQAAKALPNLQRLHSDRAGVPIHVRANLGYLPLNPTSTLQALPNYAKSLTTLLRYSGTLKYLRTSNNAKGLRHIHLQQLINGVEVRNAGLTLHMRNSTGLIESLDARLLPPEKLPAAAKIPADRALASVPRDDFPRAGVKPVGTPKLVYWRASDGFPYLAWVLALNVPSNQDDCGESYELILDAGSGHVLGQNARKRPMMNREVWELVEVVPCLENDPFELKMDENDAEPDAFTKNFDIAFEHSRTVYNFLSSRFGLDSWSGTGATMKVIIDLFGNPLSSWSEDLRAARFSNGDGTTWGPSWISLDAVAHEFGHGVTGDRLYYYGQSGALNESMSDIYGAMAEAGSQAPNDETWKLFNSVYMPNDNNRAVRYMNDPAKDFGQSPGEGFFSRDDFTNLYDRPTLPPRQNDWNGVHYNSGISNLAFHLLAQGGTHPRKTSTFVPAIGTTNALQIFHAAVHGEYLGGDKLAGFSKFRTATAQAAMDLYGSAAVKSVCAAWNAVRVPNEMHNLLCPAMGPTPTAPSNVTAINGCNPISVSWSSAADSNNPQPTYLVYRSAFRSDFSTSRLIYAGPATSTTATMPIPDQYLSDGTPGAVGRYFRVQACNTYACSAPSEPVFAEAFPGFMCN